MHMKRLVFLLTLILLSLQAFTQDTLRGTVIKVHDGDTFTFKTEKDSILKIRMKDIDAPELSQPYGKESRKYLLKYLNKNCRVVVYNYDKYGRLIGFLLYSRSNININSVKSGNAWNYATYNHDIRFTNAQAYAQKHNLGLWARPQPIPPWIWRKNHQQSSNE